MSLQTFLLIVFCLHVSAAGISQKITINQERSSLQTVLGEIEKQSEYKFFYKEKLLKSAKPVTVHIADASLEDALNACFKGQPYEWSLVNKLIVLKEKPVGIAEGEKTIPGFFAAKVSPIKGYVTDGDGNLLAGATIAVKNSNASTKAASDGSFVINASAEDVLVISFIGYDAKEIKLSASLIKSGNIGTTALVISPTAMREVQVNKGYYSEKSSISTGNISIVKGEDIVKQPVTDPLLALEGRVPGLTIEQASGIPGAYANVQIRGRNNIIQGILPLTTFDPLYVVDGVPYSSATLTTTFLGAGILGTPQSSDIRPGQTRKGLSPFNNLNPADIESIETLKDADATAIYGSKGSNGVILITTKRGKPGKTSFNVNIASGESRTTKRLPLLNTQQYLQLRHDGFANDGAVPGINDFDINGVWDTTRYTDWQKVFLGNAAPFTNVNAGLSGGSNNTQFSLNGGYSRNGTTLPGAFDDEKMSLSTSIVHNIHNLKVNFAGSYMNDNSNLPAVDLMQSILLAPDAPALYDQNGNINWEVHNGTTTFTNPMASTVTRSRSITRALLGSLDISYKLFKGFELRNRVGYSYSQMNQNITAPSTASPPPNNDANSRSNSFAESTNRTWIVEPQANYNTTIGGGRLNTFIAATLNNNTSGALGYTARIFSSDALIENPQAAAQFSFRGSTNAQIRSAAIFGGLNYNWQDKYAANLILRRDGSSKFGPKNQFGNFGSLGMSWIFSKEKWIATALPFLSFGKLQGSYGVTGSDQIALYQYLSTFSPSSPAYLGISTLQIGGIANPYFQWQKDKKLGFSLETGFFHDRFQVLVSFYQNRTGNQLIQYTLPTITGRGSVQSNLPALIQNKGWEFTVHSVNIQSGSFSWTTDFNISINRDKLIAYPSLATSDYSTTYSIGRSLTSALFYDSVRVNSATGLYEFASKDGSGYPSIPQDAVWSKPIAPRFDGGITNRFSYKGLQLDIFIQFMKKIGYNYLRSFSPPGTSVNQMTNVLDRWQKPGDHATIERATAGYDPDNLAAGLYQYYLTNSIATLTDASYIRLKNIALSYQLPARWLNAAHLQSAAVSLGCSNLLTITNYLGMDPETGALGMPPMRTITAGIRIGL